LLFHKHHKNHQKTIKQPSNNHQNTIKKPSTTIKKPSKHHQQPIKKPINKLCLNGFLFHKPWPKKEWNRP